MITRLWLGWTSPDNAEAYERIVSTEVLPSIARRGIDGYRGAYLLRREVGDEVEFATILLFESLEALREFGGEDYGRHMSRPRRGRSYLASTRPRRTTRRS